MKNNNKVIDLKTAVERYVTDGCSVYLGGGIAREPFSSVREIVLQKKKNLTLMGSAFDHYRGGACRRRMCR